MSKSITTLVKDIYALMEKDTPLTVDQAKRLGERITKTLISRLATPAERRTLSMSSLGSKCLRQLWYKEHKPELAEPLPPHVKLNFLMGHIIEDVNLELADAAGHTVEGEQDTMEYCGVKGHRDAVIDGVTVDVKSANSRSINKFKEHNLDNEDPFGYRTQLDLYVLAGKDDDKVKVKGEGAFLAVDKELGHLVLDRYRVRDEDYEKKIQEVRRTLQDDEPPARGYNHIADGKSGNYILPLECRYCPFKYECYKDVNNGRGLRKFLYSNGPRWFTRVFYEPNVPEEKSDGTVLAPRDTLETKQTG